MVSQFCVHCRDQKINAVLIIIVYIYMYSHISVHFNAHSRQLYLLILLKNGEYQCIDVPFIFLNFYLHDELNYIFI